MPCQPTVEIKSHPRPESKLKSKQHKELVIAVGLYFWSPARPEIEFGLSGPSPKTDSGSPGPARNWIRARPARPENLERIFQGRFWIRNFLKVAITDRRRKKQHKFEKIWSYLAWKWTNLSENWVFPEVSDPIRASPARPENRFGPARPGPKPHSGSGRAGPGRARAQLRSLQRTAKKDKMKEKIICANKILRYAAPVDHFNRWLTLTRQKLLNSAQNLRIPSKMH